MIDLNWPQALFGIVLSICIAAVLIVLIVRNT